MPDTESRIPAAASPLPPPLFACIHRPGAPEDAAIAELSAIAGQFSPRYECHGGNLVSIDVSGLERLLGPAQTIGEELRREAAARGVRAHVAVAGTRVAAMVLAIAQPGLTVVARGAEAEALAPIAIGILQNIPTDQPPSTQSSPRDLDQKATAFSALSAVERWGLKTLGELAALPPADLAARIGRPAASMWQAVARGEDIRPLVPARAEERFDASVDLEWPIEELEPLSFVLTRLLEPLSTRLERRDRGAATLHLLLRLVTRDPSTGTGREVYARRLELPTPIRDVRTLRTLALLDLEAHPPDAAIDRVTIVIDPTPGRILQHALFTRAQPTVEQLSTLVARLGAVMGHDRFGAPATVDSYRPGAFALRPFAVAPSRSSLDRARDNPEIAEGSRGESRVVAALRRCRPPVPARVAMADCRPVRVTTDRRGFAGGSVVRCAGPWRTSGAWWEGEAGRAWDRDEWDVSLSDGAVYRVCRDRATDRWFVDAIVD